MRASYGADPARSCHAKRRYATSRVAKAMARKMRRGGLGTVVAYRCDHCDGFHVGHDYRNRSAA